MQEGDSGDTDEVEVALDFPPADMDTPVETARPFFLPSICEQRISTRQITTGSDKRRHKCNDLATVAYNVVNEPWVKYVPTYLADRGYTTGQFIVSRFQQEVLYLEVTRYASAFIHLKHAIRMHDRIKPHS